MSVSVNVSSRHIFAFALVAIACAITCLTTPIAQAGYFHRSSTSFTLANSASPFDVAINQSNGEVYASSLGSDVVEAFEASGAPDPTHPKLTDVNGTTPYPFSSPFGLAVDNSAGPDRGDIYVANNAAGALIQFDPSGVRTAQSPITVANIPKGGTAQSGGLPAVVNNEGFTPGGVAVAANGDVYVSDLANLVVDVFEPNGAFVSQFAAGHIAVPYAIALDPSGDLYVADGAGTIEFDASGACVNSCAPIDLSGAFGVTTDDEGNFYDDEGARVTEFNSSFEPLQSFGEEAISLGRGLAFNEASGAIYVADEGAGKIEVYESFIAPAPEITAESITDVHSESAQLHAKINPRGGYTTYRFEYGTDTSYGTSEPVPDVNLKPSITFQSVQLNLDGLKPDTTYHWRVVATNAASPPGGTPGPDHTFTTYPFVEKINESCANSLARQQTGAALLLDCRAYELVSARNTGGYNVSSDLSEGAEAPFGGYPEAESPSRILYSVDHGAIPGTDNPTNKGSDPYVATRGENGWNTEYVGIPADNPFAAAPFSSVPSGANSSLETFAFGAPGGCSPCFEGGYTGIPVRFEGKLVQGMAGSLNPGPGAKPAGQIANDISADGTHFIFGSKSKFEPDGNEGEVSIYDHNLSTGETHVVSETPSGETMKEEGSEISELDISADGSHILIGKLTGEAEGAKLYHLYMNVGDEAKTIELTPGAAKGVRFDGMTADGKKVFFSSEEHLTGEDEGHSGADIFNWEEGQPLTLISTGTEGDAGSCDPAANTLHKHWNTTGAQNCGDVAIGGGGGVATGNGTFYFLSPSLLDGSQEPQDGVKSAPNLYVVRPGQAPHFVATLESALTGPLQSRHALLRSFGSFAGPEFIATDQSTGDVYVSDSATGTIYKTNSAGEPVAGWRDDGKLALGGAIATDPSNGNLYVGTGGEVREYTPAGVPIRSFSDGTNGYEHGIAVDGAGDVYVYDSFYDYIAKFSSTGEEFGTVLSSVSATSIEIGPASGELYLGREGKTVERYSFNGAGKAVNPKVVASGLSNASGITVDFANDVYVDEGNRVLQFDSSGEEVSVPIGAGVLGGSDGVGVGPAGDVYAGDPSHTNLAEFGPAEASPNPRTDNPAVADAVSEPETRRTADFQVSPAGEFAAFTATLPLGGAEVTGYPEVFRYDAADNGLECASCNDSNAEATGGSSLAARGSSLTEAGQVFFNSEEPLALRDTDKLTDVYEWEPSGTGSCGPESPTYISVSSDCLGLISTGSSPFNSKLLGVSANGLDAYFFTRDTLVPQDENGELVKIYDARVDGGFFVTPEPPPCRASDECHGAGSPPPPPPDFDRNLGESGNEVSAAKCKKGFVQKHGKCVRKSRSHKHRGKKAHQGRSRDHRGGKK